MGELNYQAFGDARRPAILFLHGFMGSAEDWKAIAAALAERFYCVVVDLPGHGGSVGLPPEDYTMENAAGSLTNLLANLGVGRATVVGYSMGGRLALYFALRHPDLCSGLFLESTSPGLESPEERESRRKLDEQRARRLESEDFERFLEDWYSQPLFATLARDEALLRRTIEARRRNDPVELAKSLRGMGTGSQPSLWAELPGFSASTLAVAGVLDEKYVEIARRMADASPELRAAVVPEAGHNARAENPEAYTRFLKDFLERSAA